MLTAFISKLRTPHISAILRFAHSFAGEKIYFFSVQPPAPPLRKPFLGGKARLVFDRRPHGAQAPRRHATKQTRKQTDTCKLFSRWSFKFHLFLYLQHSKVATKPLSTCKTKKMWPSFWGLQSFLEALRVAYKRILPME